MSRSVRSVMPAMSALAVAASLALAGCMSTPDAGWRVQPTFRVDQASLTGVGHGYLALARQYEGERRWDQALQAYRKAALEAPMDEEILNALGLAEAGQGNLARAVAALRRAVALAPQRVQFVNNLGYALMLDGRADEARGFLRLALTLEPGHARARQNLEQAEARLAVAPPAPAAAESTPAPSVPVAAAAEPDAAPSLRVFSAPNLPPLHVSRAPLEPVSTAATTATMLMPAALDLPLARVAEPSVPEPAAPRVLTLPNLPPMQVGYAALPSSAAPISAAAPEPMLAVVELPLAAIPLAVESEPASLPRPRVEISNGNGVRGMAARLAGWLRDHGVEGRSRLTNLRPYVSTTTVVQYGPGFAAQAQEIARRMPASVEVTAAVRSDARSDVRVVLGHDIRELAVCLAHGTCRSTTAVAAADASR
jgi:hypothetical protein